jgi:pyridoxamine 5'-phosphate oxidase family protein
LATVDAAGAPQNNAVGCRYNAEAGTLDIYGYNMGASRKFRNLAANDRVALVIDDLKSVRPWAVRGLEIRGRAEALTGYAHGPAESHLSPEVIRVHPRLIFSWGLNPEVPGMQRRVVPGGR